MAFKPTNKTPKPSAFVAQKAGMKKCPNCGKSPCQCKKMACGGKAHKK